MLNDLISGLVTDLNKETVEGGLLEGVVSVLEADALPIPGSEHPAVTVDWIQDSVTENPRSSGGIGTRWETQFQLVVSMYVVSAKKGIAAERTLRNLYLREESGNLKGLKVALVKIQNVVTENSRRFLMRYGNARKTRPNDIRRGEIVKGIGCYTVGIEIPMSATTWAGQP